MRERGDTIAEGAAERARLVRLCAYLTGDAQAAEDLAQETLVEAWRHAHKLHDPHGREPWLRAIARNVCLRWRQRRRHEASHLAPTEPDADDAPPDQARQAAAADLEIALERSELADLLDRALALLPPTTRDVLVARYIDESPHGEIAARLGLSESAVKMQVARGKLTLRRVLTTQFPAEAQAFGVSVPDTAGEQETRIWCPICGRRRLVGRFDRGVRQFALRCPACTGIFNTGGDEMWPAPLDTISGFKPALSRLLAWGTAYWHGRAGGNIPCQNCGRVVPCRTERYDDLDGTDLLGGYYVAYTDCPSCGPPLQAALGGIALGLPACQRFWRAHPRMRTLVEREVEAGGRAALVTRFESVTGGATLDVIFTRDTFEVIGIHGDPRG